MITGRHWSIGMLCLFCATNSLFGQGFPNVVQTPGELLTPLLAPHQGRTAVIAYHNGWLYTVPEMPASQPNSDFLVRRWDLSDLSDVEAVEIYDETNHPVMAHGYLKIGDYLALGDNWPQDRPFSFRAVSPGVNQRSTLPGLRGPYDRGDLFQPWHINTYWSYNPEEIDDLAVLRKNGETLATWDHIGETGVIGHPFIIGNLLIFASDQSRTGVATYDISDPANPRLLDVLKTGGPGGYWPELWGGDGKLYVVFPYREPVSGMRVVDVTDPENMSFIADVPLPGAQAMYVQFQDEFAFLGSHKVDMRTTSSVLRLDTEGESVDTSQFLLPLGNLLATGGIDRNQGLAIWAHQADPDTRGPSVGFHLPRAGQTHYPVGAPVSLLIHETLESPTITVGENFIVRPIGGDALPGTAVFAFNDILTFTPDANFLPDTTYEVVLPEGGIKDVSGNGIEGYSFTFSTGPTISGNLPPEVTDFSSSVYPAAPGTSVDFTATATDPEEDELEYRFNFGDGDSFTGWSTAPTASHSYDQPGHYPAKVQVRDPSGVQVSAIVTVTVTDRSAEAPPGRSSPVVLDEERRQVWTVNPDNNTITAIDADTLEKRFEVPVGKKPVSVVVDPSGTAWIACEAGDRIDRVSHDGTTLSPVLLDYGDAPAGILFSSHLGKIFVSLSGSGDLIRIDVGSGAIDGRIAVGPTPRALAFTPDESVLYVARFVSTAHFGEIREIAASDLSIQSTIRLNKLGGDSHRDSSAEGKGIPNYLAGMAVSHDGSRLLVVSNKMNTDRGLLTGVDLDQDNTVRNLLSVIDTEAGEVIQSIDIDNSDSASAVSFSPLGDYFFVTLQGNNDLSVFDTFSLATSSGLGSFLSRQRIGKAPHGLCVDPTTDRLFAKNFLSRDLTVIELEGFSARGRADFPKVSVSTVASESLAAAVLRGKQVFYDASDPRMSGEGYQSCATCHFDGGHDGRTWDFTGRGEGLRNTTSLLGKAGLQQGNLHWTANFDELQDFEHDIRNAFGGTGFLTDSQFAETSSPGGNPKAGLNPDLDALAAYVTSLGKETIPRSPHRESDGEMSDEALTGAEIFEREGCATCHTGSEMTDGLLHNIGTLRDSSGSRLAAELAGIETPTLRGIWESAPYLHDGSAETLEEVFSTAGGFSLQAEDGQTSGNASIEVQWTEYNNDGSLREGGLAQVWEGGVLTLTEVEGGSGGTGAVEVRYSSGYRDGTLTIRVNGTEHHTEVSPTGNVPDWRYVNWDSRRFEGVELTPGKTNTIEIFVSDPVWLPVAIDEILVSTPDTLSLATPHHKVRSLPPGEQANLLAFLRELDGSDLTNVPAPPAAPDGLQISQAKNDPPLLRWNSSPGSSSYRIYRSGDGEFASATVVAETEDLFFVDGDMDPLASYTYWVTALNDGGESLAGAPVIREADTPEFLPPIPDLSIGRTRSTLTGDNVYGGRQFYVYPIRRLRTARASFALQNDGETGTILLSAQKRDRSMKVRYFTKTGARKNITSALTSVGHRVSELPPERTIHFQMLIRAGRNASRKHLPIHAETLTESPNRDHVTLKAIVRS